jgi:hypothetical protein
MRRLNKNTKMGSQVKQRENVNKRGIKDPSRPLIVVMIHGSGKDNRRGVKVLSTPSPLRPSYFNNSPSACVVWLIVKASMGNFIGSTSRAWQINHGPIQMQAKNKVSPPRSLLSTIALRFPGTIGFLTSLSFS